jgi:hypothetical protein
MATLRERVTPSDGVVLTSSGEPVRDSFLRETVGEGCDSVKVVVMRGVTVSAFVNEMDFDLVISLESFVRDRIAVKDSDGRLLEREGEGFEAVLVPVTSTDSDFMVPVRSSDSVRVADGSDDRDFVTPG